MSTQTPTSLVFKVRRATPELVPPAAPTPREWKELSDIDDQEALRFQIPVIMFYRNDDKLYGVSSLRGRDPAKVIKEAVGKALVPYYPFAGRLREKEGRKLVVECNGEGVLFTEADADVSLEEFGDALQPPFPCFEELLFDVPGSGGILDTPLLLFQVTRLKCGGFIFALKINHTMADAVGIQQFLNTVGGLARGDGAPKLSAQPVWERHLLRARDPPRVTCAHPEYDEMANNKGLHIDIPPNEMIHKSFFFGAREMSGLRRLLTPQLKSSSTYEVLTACIWRCRTMALQFDPNEDVRLVSAVNVRSKLNPGLPTGYYGNVLAFPIAQSTAGELCQKPLGYAVELVKKAKANVTDEYMRSLADFMHIKGRPCLITFGRSFVVSNLTRMGLDQLDFGWGLPMYGGTAGELPGIVSFVIPSKNNQGERGIIFPICLPAPAMGRFAKQLHRMLTDFSEDPNPGHRSSVFIASSL